MRPVRLRNRGKYLILDLIVTTGFPVVMTALLWMIHRKFDEHFAQSALVGILGLAVGIFIAIVLTPFTAEENTKWSNLTSAVVGAISKCSVGLWQLCWHYIFKDARLLKDPLLGARTAIFNNT